jgi:anti-sigma factor RsiW
MTRWRCRRYQPWLVDHADGVLDAAHRQPLEQHLACCPDCRADLEALRALPAVLQTSSVPDPGGAFWLQQRQAIGRAIGNLPSPGGGRPVGWLREVLQPSPWRYPIAATVALLLAFAVYRVAEQPSASVGPSIAARLATLDTDVLLTLGELAQAATPTDELLNYNPPDDEVAAEALAVAELVGPHLPAHVPVPDEAELNDTELDGVADLIGTIG